MHLRTRLIRWAQATVCNAANVGAGSPVPQAGSAPSVTLSTKRTASWTQDKQDHKQSKVSAPEVQWYWSVEDGKSGYCKEPVNIEGLPLPSRAPTGSGYRFDGQSPWSHRSEPGSCVPHSPHASSNGPSYSSFFLRKFTYSSVCRHRAYSRSLGQKCW